MASQEEACPGKVDPTAWNRCSGERRQRASSEVKGGCCGRRCDDSYTSACYTEMESSEHSIAALDRFNIMTEQVSCVATSNSF